MALNIRNTPLGDRLEGPETDSDRLARVQTNRKGVLSINTMGLGSADLETAERYARELQECIDAIRIFEKEKATNNV